MDQECFEADLSMALREIKLKLDTNSLLLAYTKAVSNTINKYAPVKSRVRKSKGREPWFTDDIHHARKLRRVNEKRWRDTRLEVHRQIYVQHRAEVNTLITRAKQRYFEEKLRSRNQKACFSVLDQLLKSSATKLPSTTSTESLCNQFSSFFTEKIQLIREKIGGQSATHQADTTVISASPVSNTLSQLRATTEEELGKIIRRCPSKTCCLDPIPTDLLQETLNTHLPYLVSLVNTSFSEGQFPKSLKTAIVKPLLKKDNLDKEILKNYRPVSNIPFVSKVMEKVAVSRLIEHLDQNNLHEEHQSAYKALHSTETALLRVHNDISQALDDNRAVLFVMLDLSAAFDTIDQNQLLDVMEADFGITEKALTWFKTYLKGRTQKVKINSAKSSRVPLQCGVPQGSVLGPVMFVLLTTPLQKIFKKHGVYYHKYADDIQLYVIFDPAIPGDRERAIARMEACVKDIREWMARWWLKLNDDKTEMLIFMSKHHFRQYGVCPITIGDSVIPAVEDVRNLGVKMDQHLSMAQQVTAVCAACNYHLYRLSSIRRYLTTNAIRNAVQALITSRLDYCNSLLAALPPTQIAQLQRVQNKAARLVTRTFLRDHITPVLRDLHWLPVECRIKYKTLITVFKCIHDMAPLYLKELLHIHSRDSRLRQSGRLILRQPIARKCVGEQSFKVVAPKLWNTLPEELRAAQSLNVFKRQLKTHLFNMYFN